MTDHANISLQVARILWPECEWVAGTIVAYRDWLPERGFYDGVDELQQKFDYRTDAAGFQMACYLAEAAQDEFDKACLCSYLDKSLCESPNLALATAIIELKGMGDG